MLSGAIVKPKPTALVAYWGYGELDGPWTMEHSTHHGEKITAEAVAGSLGKKVLTNTDAPADQKPRGTYYRYLRQNGQWGRAVTGMDAVTQKEALAPFCPIRRITSDYPPILMVHGTKDTDVPYSCSVDMVAELTKHGVKHDCCRSRTPNMVCAMAIRRPCVKLRSARCNSLPKTGAKRFGKSIANGCGWLWRSIRRHGE